MLGPASGQLAPVQDHPLDLQSVSNRYGLPSMETV